MYTLVNPQGLTRDAPVQGPIQVAAFTAKAASTPLPERFFADGKISGLRYDFQVIDGF